MKTIRIPNDSYFIINLIFAGIILAVFAYSLFYGDGRTHLIPSGSELLTGQDSVSTGLSRSFSAIVRFNFAEARGYNPHGIRIFLFFLVQLFMRVGGCMLHRYPKRKLIVSMDIIVSSAMFFVFFLPFIVNLIRQYTSE